MPRRPLTLALALLGVFAAWLALRAAPPLRPAHASQEVPCPRFVILEGVAHGEGLHCLATSETPAALLARLGLPDCRLLGDARAMSASLAPQGLRLQGDPSAEGCALRPVPLPAAARLALGLPLDLSRASAADLALIPGLGPALARRIVALRGERGGRFARLDELNAVRGLGAARLEQLRPYLSLEAPP